MRTQAEAEARLTAPLGPRECLHHCNRALAYFNDAPDSGDLVVCQGICVSAGTRYLHCWIERDSGDDRQVIDLTQLRPFFPLRDYYRHFEVTEVKPYDNMDLLRLMADGVAFWGFEGTDAVSVPTLDQGPPGAGDH